MLVMKHSSGSPLRGVFLRHKLAVSLVIYLPLRRGLLGGAGELHLRSEWKMVLGASLWDQTFWVQILTCHFVVM